MREVIVIGAGLSGLMGALALAEAGLRPLLLAKGHGATHWTGGTIDVWGAAEGSLRAALADLVAGQPAHPYALVGVAGVAEAIERFRALTEAARYPYVGGLERNVLLPTAAGALRPAALFPATMAAGDARLDGPLLIAGFRELRDFYPPLVAAGLATSGLAARGAYLRLPPTRRTRDFSTRTFAQLFDDPAWRADVGRQLRELRGDARRIGLPAVLGLRDPLGAVADLQQQSGAQVFEIPTLPPSVPGMRLLAIFQAAIERLGGRVQIGSEVLGATAEAGRLVAVTGEAAGRNQEYRARRFLLATGGVAGGGVRTDYRGTAWETALGLPLRAPAGRGEWFAPRFVEGQHAIYRAGVAADARMRPLDASGAPIYDNLAVAGGALAGADTLRERARSGVAITTGWHAGTLLGSWQP